MGALLMLRCDDSKTYIVEVADILTADECAQLIQKIEDLSPEIATINTARGTKVRTDIRNNERVISRPSSQTWNISTVSK